VSDHQEAGWLAFDVDVAEADGGEHGEGEVERVGRRLEADELARIGPGEDQIGHRERRDADDDREQQAVHAHPERGRVLSRRTSSTTHHATSAGTTNPATARKPQHGARQHLRQREE